MKTNRTKTNVLAIAVAFLIPVAIRAASTVTFDNQSGKPALESESNRTLPAQFSSLGVF